MPVAAFDCFRDPAAFVIDGANRVCMLGQAGDALRAAVLILGLLCLGAFVLAAKRPTLGAKLLSIVTTLVLAALLPGLAALLLVRADAPLRASRTADVVRDRLSLYRAAAAGLACVDLIKNECIACQPLAQLTFRACEPPPKGSAAPRGRAQFGEMAFTTPVCQRHGDAVSCGTKP